MRMMMGTIFVYFILVSVLVVCCGNPNLDQQSGLPTLRSLSRTCADSDEGTEVFCVADPAGCEKGDDYPCSLITTISKFDLPCIRSNLNDPYIRTLCAKRFSTYLITLLRLVSPDPQKRTCESEFFDTNKKCSSREFVAVSFGDKVSAKVEDDDLFYVCAADEPHVTTWTKKGKVRVNKWVQDEDKYENPYQLSIFADSGVGVYWENLEDLRLKTEMTCQFVIGVDDIDLLYELDGSAINVTHLLRNHLAPDVTSYVKMVQGVVERENETLNFEIESVNLDGSNGIAPPPPVSPNLTDPSNVTDYKIASFDKPLNLSDLEPGDYRLMNVHTRANIHSDIELHRKHWDPVFRLCQHSTAICYVLDKDPGCFALNKEACELLVTIEFLDDFKTIRLSMMVENWQWGGISFSDDRFMADDMGLYCQNVGNGTTVKPLINLRHSGGNHGNDSQLADLVTLLTNVSQISEAKRMCVFTIPTVFNISEGPFYETRFMDYDLGNKEYHVLIAVGNNHNEAVAVHRKKRIVEEKFSKQKYLDFIAGGSALTPHYFIISALIAAVSVWLRD